MEIKNRLYFLEAYHNVIKYSFSKGNPQPYLTFLNYMYLYSVLPAMVEIYLPLKEI